MSKERDRGRESESENEKGREKDEEVCEKEWMDGVFLEGGWLVGNPYLFSSNYLTETHTNTHEHT